MREIKVIATAIRRIYGLAPTKRMDFELSLDNPKMPAKVLARPLEVRRLLSVDQ